MSRHNQKGFTLTELSVSMVVIGIVIIGAFTIFNNSINSYLGLQQDASEFQNLTVGSQRIGNVLRGLTDITTATENEVTLYAYFSPNDSYVSLIRYYISGSNPSLYADVTPMTANPPGGSLINSSKKTYTIIENFYQQQGVNTFTYLDANGTALTMPISDLHTIKGIKVSLAVPINVPTANGSRVVNVQVSLRNRKTNL